MKNLLGTIIIAVICGFAVNTASAQSSACTPDASFTSPGLYPVDTALPCITRNIWQGITVYFKNYDTTSFHGSTIHIDSVRIDTIGNMPAGYTWTSNKAPSNTFAKLESGCIFISGMTTDPAGEYKLNIAVTAYIAGVGVPYNADALGLRYDVRVIDSVGSTCPAIDTAAAGLKTSSANGGKGTNNGTYVTSTGIFEADNSVSGMANYPNPFSGNTQIVYSATSAKQMTFRVYNVLGETLHTESVYSVAGKNMINFNGNNLQSGVYFYSITDGTRTSTNRMVITK